ncbi:alpha/beta fold hydrolase [Hymenobacter lucidus]|uniref:Alpha/beta fold hydrolase n=1 Tax=Hymenobacter lucidus TaxID=2880930 RepID=A0ABS8ASU0_9BACT|nr:alpha/beta fold hydrolase [Hymenobacter lucidus]MCB2408829.1 alpha/beta fold hydrolase [Hymenobacter lucidus]
MLHKLNPGRALVLGLLGWTLTVAPAHGQAPSAALNSIRREDFIVKGPVGALAVRRVTSRATPPGARVLLLLHGGGAGGVASFDLPVPGGSLAVDLAQRGLTVYLMNVRGWGGSDDPTMAPTDTTHLNVTCREASADIDRVVQTIRRRENVPKMALFGWATGGHWGGYYASHHAPQISHFISLNSLYGVRAPWALRASFAHPRDSTRFNRGLGPWRLADVAAMSPAQWDRLIPAADKTRWRDPAVTQAYAQTAVETDQGSATRTPATLRVPGGWREESFNQSLGTAYWRASDLLMPVLGLRGALDFWSRPADLAALDAALVLSPRHKVVTLPQATHFVFLDRPDKGRDQLLQEIVEFLRQ